ncbi:hypothetical protein ACFIJ5_12690 [Haloimpatiens sp. FM7330]|uniref:hypothetical protein n=1 Tax=Haloimpatiens sp. FM7330 TaxID=3298610 RepID=UPI00362D0378
MNNINKKNSLLILIYLIITTSILMCYLFMVDFNVGTYDFDTYKKTYMYFMGFQFLIFTIIMSCFYIDESIDKKSFIVTFIEVCTAAISSVPLILLIFAVGNINYMNFFVPILLQIVWGLVIVTFRKMLKSIKIEYTWRKFLVSIFIFTVIVVTLVFAFMYYKYGKLVVTTVYDKDLPIIFFINPLITMIGYIYMEISNYTQMGVIPVIVCMAFYLVLILINSLLTYKFKFLGGKKY